MGCHSTRQRGLEVEQNAVKYDALADWRRVMDMSRDMLEGARTADWDRVCRLQEERFALIRRFFAGSPSGESLDLIRPDVNALLDMDAEVEELGNRARQKIAEGLQSLNKGKSVRKAYGG